MKLEYLADGSPNCPLIRLYGFAPSEVSSLKDVCASLADGCVPNVQLHELPFIDAIAGCTLRLQVAGTDDGILQVGPARFDCRLSTKAWAEIAERIDPFTKGGVSESSYQWLNEDGEISLLLSPTGRW